MSFKNHRDRSVSKIATALCLLSAGASSAGAGNVPKLIRTTTPIRVQPAPERDPHGGRPESNQRPESPRQDDVYASDRMDDVAAGLRDLLDPNSFGWSNPGIKQTAVGLPRTNHFVELDSDGAIDNTPQLSATRSVAIPQRSRRQPQGAIQTNPLVVDSPPELRRFSVDDRPGVLPNSDHASAAAGVLVAREQALPPQPVADLDEALSALSVDTDPGEAIVGTARSSGFGMLAIDQIGNHLENKTVADPSATYPPAQRFPTDLVLPSFDLELALEKDATDSLRGRLGTVDTESLIEAEIPQLPSSTDSLASDTTATSLDWFEHELDTSDLAPEIAIAEIDTAASPPANRIASAPHAAPPATVPLEIDELLAASASTPDATNSQTESRVEKPSLVERFAGWSKRLTPGKQTQESKAVSMRLPPEQVENQPISHAQKRSGGILTQWLNRSR